MSKIALPLFLKLSIERNLRDFSEFLPKEMGDWLMKYCLLSKKLHAKAKQQKANGSCKLKCVRHLTQTNISGLSPASLCEPTGRRVSH